MSTPNLGLALELDLAGLVLLLRTAKWTSGWELESLSGVLQPSSAVNPAWWLTLNSRPNVPGQDKSGDQ